MDASNLLKPALQSGTLRCIGSTTYKEYRQHFEKDRALVRRFQKIDVNEPSVPDAIEILKGLKPYFEDFHQRPLHQPGDQVGGGAVGEVHPRPQAARQGDRRDRRDRRLADAAARAAAAQDHRRARRSRRPSPPWRAFRRRRCRNPTPRCCATIDQRSEAGGVRPGQGDRGAGRRDQAVARRLARARKADRLLHVLRPDRRRQDRGRAPARAAARASSCSAST